MSDLFFGRYFKCCAKDTTAAFIPAKHRDGKNRSASLQIVADGEAHCITFPYEEYGDLGDGFGVRLGDCLFEKSGITLDLKRADLTASGRLSFGRLTPPEKDIMGPFRFLPFMQCRHSVYSLKHTLGGSLTLNGKEFCFDGGIGYIEGDRGRSFPEEYVWTHAFSPDGASVMISAATVPIGPFGFTGTIASVYLDGREYRLATYRGAKVKIGKDEIVLKQNDLTLRAQLIEKRSVDLYAPRLGDMARVVKESAACRARYRLERNGAPLLEFETPRASFEFEIKEHSQNI